MKIRIELLLEGQKRIDAGLLLLLLRLLGDRLVRLSSLVFLFEVEFQLLLVLKGCVVVEETDVGHGHLVS